MPTRQQNLQTALDNVAAQLATMTANPKPSYSADGQSVSWGEHFNNLLAAQDKLLAQLQASEGPWEVITIGR